MEGATMTIKATDDIVTMDDYGAHIYVDTEGMAPGSLAKEQSYVNHSGKPRLVHPHKYGDKCGNIMHLRLSPYEDAVELRIIAK